MKNILKKMVWLVLMLMFCLPPAFAVDGKDYTAATPTSDFVDNGDGTVTHKKTGLTWMRCSMGQTWTGSTCSGAATEYKWDEAMRLKNDFAGKKNWRLPNIDELLSIVDKGAEKAINSTIFPNALFEGDNILVWSSSPYASDSSYAFFVSFSGGHEYGGSKSHSYAVRLVRGGQWFSGFLEGSNKEAAEHAAQKQQEVKEKAEQERAAAAEEKCMKTPKCRAKKEREEAARRAKEERAQEAAERYKRQHICDRYYPGRVGKFKRGGFFATDDDFVVRYVNKDREMVTIEGTSGGNSLKRGETKELSCSDLESHER